MKPLALNLSKVKKISSDGKSSTFLHPDGHRIVIAHSAVSALQRKQIENLPVHKYASGSDDGPVSADDGADNSLDIEPIGQNTTVTPVSAPDAPKPLDIEPVSDAEAAQAASPQAAAPAINTDTLTPQSVYSDQLKGIRGQAAAESQLGNDQADIEAQHQQDLADAQSKWNETSAGMLKDVQNSLDDVKDGHINPNHFMETRTGPQKLLAGLGVILGGIAQGTQGGSNHAMDFLTGRINQDVEAQKAGLNNKLNVYHGYLQKYNIAAVADSLARATQTGIYASQLRQAGAEARSPLAKANADLAAGQLKQSIIPLVQNAHLMQSFSKFNGTQPSAPNQTAGSEGEYLTALGAAQRINPGLHKDQESKYIPSIGVAKLPLTPEDRDGVLNLTNLNKDLDTALDLQKNFGVTGAWTPQSRADANSVRERLNVSLGQLYNLKRLNEHEFNNYKDQIGSIGGINAGGTLEGLNNLKQAAASKQNILYNQLGVSRFPGVQSPAASVAQIPGNPGDMINFKNGRKGQVIDTKGNFRYIK